MLADLHRQSAETTMGASACPLFTQSQYTEQRRHINYAITKLFIESLCRYQERQDLPDRHV